MATCVTKDGWRTVAKRIIHKQKLPRDGGQGQQLGGEQVFELGEGQGVKQPGLEVEEELAGLGEGGGQIKVGAGKEREGAVHEVPFAVQQQEEGGRAQQGQKVGCASQEGGGADQEVLEHINGEESNMGEDEDEMIDQVKTSVRNFLAFKKRQAEAQAKNMIQELLEV